MTAHYQNGEHVGPKFPAIAAANRWRKLAAKGPLSADDTKAYGAAVLEGIRKLQRTELQRELPTHACPCASGTWLSEGADILDAVRKQHLAAMHREAAADRARRTDAQIMDAYKAAMDEKRAREAAAIIVPAAEPVALAAPRKAAKSAKVRTMRAAARSTHKAATAVTSGKFFIAGRYDLAAIMRAAAEAAKARLARCGGTWQGAMSIALRATWRAAKAEALNA